MLVRSSIAAALLVTAFPLAASATDATPTPSPSPSVAPMDEPPAPSADALSKVMETAFGYEQTINIAESLEAEAAKKRAKAEDAQAKADKFSGEVVDYLMSSDAKPFTQKLNAVKNAETPQEWMGNVYVEQQIAQAHVDRLHEAQKAHTLAVDLSAEARNAERNADEAAKRGETLLKRLSVQAKELGFGSSTVPVGLPGTPGEQVQWNTETKKFWSNYKNRLAATTITVPSAKALAKPTKLPDLLTPVLDGPDAVAGVAQSLLGTKKVRVFPKETVKLVDTVLSRVGDGYAMGGNKDGRWTCGGLVAHIKGGYGLSGSPAELYEKTVVVPSKQTQVGDLIFIANKTSGIHHVGVYVGHDQMVDATGARYTVGISKAPKEPFAVTRPALGKGDNTAPVGTLKKPNTVCGSDLPVRPSGWRFPMARNSYVFTAHYGESSSHWATIHTGQDFAAPTGTPIYASRSGDVSLTEVGWAGTLITVSHPDGTSELYAHTSKQLVEDGDTVGAGDPIALVGARGNVTGPHLHFEIRKNNEPVDPLPMLVKFLPNTGGMAAWGGYGNGQVPSPVLCEVGTKQRLRCDAAGEYKALAKAYREKFNTALPVSSSYKTLVSQIEIGGDGKLVDLPGTSDFGWGTRFAAATVTADQGSWINDRAEKFGWKSSGKHQWAYSPR